MLITWPASTLVTLVIGTNTRRRPGTSTTSPTTLGRSRPERTMATTSRTRPTWSPSGSNTASPAIRATKTRVALTLPG